MAEPYWFSGLFARIDAGDLDGFLDGLAPDVEVVVANNPPMRGREAVRAGLGGFLGSVAGLRHDFVAVHELGDARAGVTVQEARVTYRRHDGGAATVPAATVLERRDGAVVAMRIYCDVAPVYA